MRATKAVDEDTAHVSHKSNANAIVVSSRSLYRWREVETELVRNITIKDLSSWSLTFVLCCRRRRPVYRDVALSTVATIVLFWIFTFRKDIGTVQ